MRSRIELELLNNNYRDKSRWIECIWEIKKCWNNNIGNKLGKVYYRWGYLIRFNLLGNININNNNMNHSSIKMAWTKIFNKNSFKNKLINVHPSSQYSNNSPTNLPPFKYPTQTNIIYRCHLVQIIVNNN